MSEPALHLGYLTYWKDDASEEVEFYYPTGVRWNCVRCGLCCRDVDKRERMIRLLEKDLDRIEKVTDAEFFEEWEEGSFLGLMLKKNGKCIFLGEDGCRIYDNRALLCRMYPFWLEKQDGLFVFGVDSDCLGQGDGVLLGEDYFRELLMMALEAMDY